MHRLRIALRLISKTVLIICRKDLLKKIDERLSDEENNKTKPDVAEKIPTGSNRINNLNFRNYRIKYQRIHPVSREQRLIKGRL
jgi:hypothetical protein